MENNVLLVFGGKSFEHDISIITALTIFNRVKNCKYNLLPLYLSKNNEWFLFLGKNFNISYFKDFENNYLKYGFVKAYFKSNKFLYYKKGLFEKKINILSVLNCSHGGVGEDGTISAYLEMLKVPCSSGNILSLSVAMDKVMSKYYFKQTNLPTIKYFTFTKQEFLSNRENVLKKINDLNFPLILKPATLGSSIGIKLAKNIDEFIESALVAIEFDDTILVEKAIVENMREFNVACLKYKNKVLISDIDEPKRSDEIFSFKDKYIGEGNISSNKKPLKKTGFLTNKIKDVDLNEKLKIKIKQFSEKIYNDLKFLGPVRIDFIMDKKEKIYVNEINSIPGSLAYYFFIPKYFKTMNNYIEAIIDESINYFGNKNKINKEFITKLI